MEIAQQNQADRGKVTYQVAGQDVSLSYHIVRSYLTKGNSQVTDQDLTQFISVCKYNQLNPFLNEAYLVKFGSQPAQMIVSKEALFKRAEASSEYDGLESGIIVLRDGQVIEIEGCFHLDSDKLVGGWCKVYRKDRKFPFVCKVRLEEYDKKQSIWSEKKPTMISKIAKVQALREAFPTQIGAMYTQEEQGVVDTVAIEVKEEIRNSANKEEIVFEDVPNNNNHQAVTPAVEDNVEEIPESLRN